MFGAASHGQPLVHQNSTRIAKTAQCQSTLMSAISIFGSKEEHVFAEMGETLVLFRVIQ